MNPKKKIIIISVIFGIIFLTLICFIIYPLFKGIKRNSQEIITVKKELISFQKATDNFGKLKETYKELEPTLEKIDKIFIDPKIPIDLIKFWEETAKEAELSIDISPLSAKTDKSDPWNSMDFQLIITGYFSNFLKFLEKVEAAPYLFEIQNLAVQKFKEGELNIGEIKQVSQDKIRAVLLIKVYTK